jgi:hypothetical protein
MWDALIGFPMVTDVNPVLAMKFSDGFTNVP